MKKKSEKQKIKPVLAWGIISGDGELVPEAYQTRPEAVSKKFKGEKTVRVQISIHKPKKK